MTLDVTIGRFDSKNNKVITCPKSKTDICNKAHTFWTNESYRSGSTPFWDFFDVLCPQLRIIYLEMRMHPNTNDQDIAFLSAYAERIASLQLKDFQIDAERMLVTRDRLTWLQYWVKKAINLYGKNAAIRFS